MMRIFLPVVAMMILTTHTSGESQIRTTPACFTRLDRDTQVGNSVTVVTNDGTVIRGIRPTVSFSASYLYMRRMSKSGLTGSVTIPFEQINRITYRKPSHARWILALVAFGIGAAAGGWAGYELSSESDRWLDFSRFGTAFVGGMLGGMIGMAGGYQIGKSITVKVTLECR